MQTGFCGICGDRGASIAWHHPDGQFAHGRCVKQFERIEASLQKALKHLFSENQLRHRQIAHAVAVNEVTKQIQANYQVGYRTLSFYLKNYSEETLIHYFNTVGVFAAIQHAKAANGAKL